MKFCVRGCRHAEPATPSERAASGICRLQQLVADAKGLRELCARPTHANELCDIN